MDEHESPWTFLTLQLMKILNATFYKNLVEPVREHVHVYHELHYVTGGETQIDIEGALYPIRAGVFFCTSPQERHHLRITSDVKPTSQYTIDVEFASRDAELQRALEAESEGERFRSIGLGHRMMFEQIRINAMSDQLFLQQSAHHRLYSFLFEFAARGPASSSLNLDYIDAALQIMQSRFPHPLSIEQMCRELGLSQSYFSRIFKRAIGVPPLRYYLQLRFENAKHLLETGNIKVKEVAAMFGFEDELYFSRLFKKWYGVSPSQCAASHAMRSRTPPLRNRRRPRSAC